MDLSEMERGHKVMLFVLGKLHDLADKGLVEGGSVQLTEDGLAAYEHLKASGFCPTAREIHGAMAAINDRTGNDE